MTERDHKYDIPIGEDAWIENIDIAGRYAQAVDIDAHLAGLWPLLERLETECVADCCGFDAYDFTREGIAAALPGLEPTQLHAAYAAATRALAALPGDVILSSRMNNLAHKRMLLRLLEHIDSCIPPAGA